VARRCHTYIRRLCAGNSPCIPGTSRHPENTEIRPTPQRSARYTVAPDSKFVVRILKLRHAVLGAAWMCTFMWMWMSFGAFVHYHNRVAARAGPTLTESQMGFGQVLALATWLPTLLDFSVIWKGEKTVIYSLCQLTDHTLIYSNRTSQECRLPAPAGR